MNFQLVKGGLGKKMQEGEQKKEPERTKNKINGGRNVRHLMPSLTYHVVVKAHAILQCLYAFIYIDSAV